MVRTRCTANCPTSEKNIAGWKIDVSGRTGASCGRDLACEIVMKEMDMRMPVAVICLSPYLIPSR